MGKEVAVRSYLRAWGTTDYLDTEGMFTKRIVNGYKRPVFTRTYEEGTDSHRRPHNRDDVFRRPGTTLARP